MLNYLLLAWIFVVLLSKRAISFIFFKKTSVSAFNLCSDKLSLIVFSDNRQEGLARPLLLLEGWVMRWSV